jgi:hypothetical protein
MKFPFFWNRNSEKLEFKRSLVVAEAQADAQRGSDPSMEYLTMIGKFGYLVGDERIPEFISENPAFNALIPALSPVNRTTKHICKKDAHIAWLDFQILYTMLEMSMHPDVYESGGMEVLQGFEIFSNTQISDAYEGWKGNILTQQVKVTRFETEKVK